MKIILAAKSVHPFHPFGGVQKYVYYFAKALARKGIDLEIVAPLDAGVPRTETFENLRYTLIRPSIQRYLEYPIGWLGVHRFSRSLARHLKSKKFDVLHAFDMAGYGYLKRPVRKPVVAQVFTDNYLSNPITAGSALNLTASKFDRIKEAKVRISPFSASRLKRKFWMQYLFKIKPIYYCLKTCDRVFVEADIVRQEIDQIYHLDGAKSAVIPVGVDVASIERMARDAPMSRKDLGLDPQDLVLITVNRLAADKGIDRILFALAALKKEVPRIKLIIIGSGYQEKELYNIIEQNGLGDDVRHYKDVPESDLYGYYNASDIYISAFSFLGSSISTLEAMACCLPVITTAQPWLVRDEENGLAIGDNSVESIKEAIVDIVRQKRLKEMGRASKAIVSAYDWDAIARQAISQYEQIIHAR